MKCQHPKKSKYEFYIIDKDGKLNILWCSICGSIRTNVNLGDFAANQWYKAEIYKTFKDHACL